MKKIFLFLFSILMISGTAYSQTKGFAGRVYDSTNVKSIVFATVSVIRKSDSILVKHTRSNQQGRFSISGLKADTFILLIAHNNYIDFVDEVILTEKDAVKELGDYNMIQRGQVLREVIKIGRAHV